MTGVVKVGLGELVTDARAGFACGEDDPEGVFQVRMNNITRTGHLDLSRRRRVPATMPAIQNCLLQTGDVLFNATNSPEMVGKTAVVSELDEPTVFSNHFIRLRVDEQKISPHYLARWLHYQFELGVFRTLCRQWVNQATVPRDSLLSLAVPLLPLAEQTRVTEVLDQVDALRAKRSESLARLDELAQSIFLDMFGDPLRGTAWPLVPLASIVDEFRYGTSNKSGEVGYPALRIPNVVGGRVDPSEIKVVDVSDAELARLRLVEGDLLFVRTNGNPAYVGRCAVFSRKDVESASFRSDHFIYASYLIRARLRAENVEPEYVREFMLGAAGRKALLERCKTSAGQYNINIEGLGSIELPIPPLDRQRKFSLLLARIDESRARMSKSKREIEDLFAALQHRAIRGEL